MKEFWQKNKWPLLIGVLAFLVRLIYLLELSRHPGFSVPMVDEKWHWEWAHEILQKSFWGEDAYFRAPLYPYFLALLAWITGSSIFWTKLLQSLVCIGTAFFLYRLADRLFGRTTALVAGLMYAFYGPFLFYETMFLIPVVFLFLLVWGMYRLVAYRESMSFKTWLATGLVFGLAAVSRPNVLLVIPFLMLWLFFIGSKTRAVWTRIKVPLALAVGVIAVIIPVTVRNAVVTGDFILISSQGGVNFYLGNNEYANGLSMLMPEVDMTDESLTWRQFIPLTKAAAEKETGRELSPAEQSAFWTRKALNFIRNNPGKFLELVWRKTVYLLNGFENSDNFDIYYERIKSRLYSLLLWKSPVFFPFGILLPLTLVGVYVRRKEFSRLLPLYMFIIAYAPSIILFLVTARHRLPLVPFMLIIAAAGVVKLVQVWKKLSRRQLIIPLILFVGGVLLVNRTYYQEGFTNMFQIHFNNGIKYQLLEDYAKAEQEYIKANDYYPFSAPLLNNLGFAQFQLGKYDEAERNYLRAIKLKPDFSRAYNNLALLMQEKGDLDSAVVLLRSALQYFDSTKAKENELGQIYLNLAEVHEDLGNLDSAAQAFSNAVGAAPLMSKAYFKAAAFFARQGMYHLTDSLYAEGSKRGDLSAGDCFNWGLSLIERKEYDAGIGMMFRALKRDEKLYQAYYGIAVSHYYKNAPADTVKTYLDLCFKYNPTYEPALNLKALLEKKKE
jgi:4-amino-4-deoxy-L-arabinose transferase-like glycosyltransferase/Tfp pilus assembly protein PilF